MKTLVIGKSEVSEKLWKQLMEDSNDLPEGTENIEAILIHYEVKRAYDYYAMVLDNAGHGFGLVE